MDIPVEIASQGFGYLLFIGAVGVLAYIYRQNQQLHDQLRGVEGERVDDLKEILKDNNEALTAVKEVLGTVATIAHNIQDRQNRQK